MPETLLPSGLRRLWSTRFLRFGLVGGSGVFINLGILGLLADLLHVDERVASAFAIEVSIIWNFILNNAWTFRDRNESARSGWGLRCLRYNMVSLVGAAVQWGVFVVVSGFIARALGRDDLGLFMYVAQLAGITLAIAWNFASNFHWTWAQKKATQAPIGDAQTREHPDFQQ